MSPWKSVLITGANRGIGLEMAKQWANRATLVIAACRNPKAAKKLNELAAVNKNLEVIQLDVSDDSSLDNLPDTVAKLLQEHHISSGGLNLLVNNAGVIQNVGSLLPTVTRPNILEHVDVNVAAPLLVMQSLLPVLRASVKANEKAVVFNISSLGGSIRLTTGTGLMGYGYRLSKCALNMVTRLAGEELRQDGILCVSVCPGWVRTDMGGAQADDAPPTSVAELIAFTDRLTIDEHSGKFFKRDGSQYPF